MRIVHFVVDEQVIQNNSNVLAFRRRKNIASVFGWTMLWLTPIPFLPFPHITHSLILSSHPFWDNASKRCRSVTFFFFPNHRKRLRLSLFSSSTSFFTFYPFLLRLSLLSSSILCLFFQSSPEWILGEAENEKGKLFCDEKQIRHFSGPRIKERVRKKEQKDEKKRKKEERRK